jgi:hypothetical protein
MRLFAICFIALISIGAILRAKKEIVDYKFSRKNKRRLINRQILKHKELESDWVNEFLNEILFKSHLKIKQ